MTDTRHYETNWSIVRITGPDAGLFLHNLTTNDVKQLAAGGAVETLFTNVKGRILAHAVLCRHAVDEDQADRIDVVVTSPHAAELATHLDRYHIREDLKLEVLPRANVYLAWNLIEAPKAQDAAAAFELPALGKTARLIIAEAPFTPSGTPLDAAEFAALRINDRFPVDRVDVDERNLPQELNRDAAMISFTKGCYLGQETVARIDALGQVNQLLVQLHCRGKHSVGESLSVDEKAIGRITSYAASDDSATGDGIALAYVRREYATPGTTLATDHGEVTVV
ncbi:MAG: glycine cleavage T C-terminal barrel domain-containing protein [Planctomycetota bacterium]